MLVERAWELGRASTLCSVSGAEVRPSKSRAYWFLKHSLSQSAYCLLPLETLLSILHDLPSQPSSLWHVAISAVAQGIVRTFSFNKKNQTSLFPLAFTLCIVIRHFRGKPFRCSPFVSPVCSIQYNSVISRRFIENSVYYSFLLTRWYNCLRAKKWICICCPACLYGVWVGPAGTLMKS